MNFTKDNVEQTFVNRGATSGQATLAGSVADRFEDFFNAEDEEAIKNLFGFLQNSIFKDSNRLYPSSDANKSLLVACCFDLGIFGLDGAEDSADTAIGFDIDTVLGVNLESLLHLQTAKNVLEMVRGDEAKLAKEHGLNITTVTWEDTSRNYNSCWGSNISDMTLGVEFSGELDNKILPVIRADNFKDRSADVDPEEFVVNVGNATEDEGERKISLKELLETPWEFLTDPEGWPLKDEDGNNKGLFAAGTDAKALVSAQACMLPVTKKLGEATYKPYIYNYQSWYSDEHGAQPHVMTIMVTRQGVSFAVCGHKSNGRTGQPIWFNQAGKRAPLVAKRPTRQEAIEIQEHKEEGRTAQDNADQHNRVLVIQVPLTPGHKKPQRNYSISNISDKLYSPLFKSQDLGIPISTLSASMAPRMYKSAGKPRVRKSLRRSRGASDMETAVIHVGDTDGNYDENLSADWTRDTASPIRITVQLAKATSNGVVTSQQMKELAEELNDVYENASRISSLVVPD